jgi:cyclophilin family peptidyl-prolyl cis-trans isomerase
LFYEKAPVSVENFLSYVRSGFYNGLVFHRVIPGFMIQGGGFDKDINQKETRAPIINEAKNGLSNGRGTIAYARTPVIKSATSQFFINLVNNTSLDYRNDTNAGYGYAVFGKVVQGMEVVDKIAAVKTGSVKGMRDVPVTPIIILEVRIIVAEE